jgi:hypothetical protein
MGKIMQFSADNGYTFPESYWAITGINLDTLRFKCEFTFTGFADVNARLDNKVPIGEYKVIATQLEFKYWYTKHIAKEVDLGAVGYILADLRQDVPDGVEPITEEIDGQVITTYIPKYRKFFVGGVDVTDPPTRKVT